MLCFLSIVFGALAIVFACAGCIAFIGFIEQDLPGFMVFAMLGLAMLCGSFFLIDKKAGLVYENVTEIQELESYKRAEPFVLAKRTVSVGTKYEDDDGSMKDAKLDINAYVLYVADSTKPIEMQGDTPVIRTLDPKYPAALVCKYKLITKGNFWYSASNEPVDDEVEWFIQIPASGKIQDI